MTTIYGWTGFGENDRWEAAERSSTPGTCRRVTLRLEEET